MSITRPGFCEWLIDSYVHKCAQICPSNVSSLLQDPSSRTQHDGLHCIDSLQNAVSAIVKMRLDKLTKLAVVNFSSFQSHIMVFVSVWSLTLQSCLCWIDQLAKTDQLFRLYFTAVVFLHAAYKTVQGSLTDEMLDVSATACLQLNDVRRCLNARHSSVLSLSQAAVLMKVVASNSRSTVQLIQIELSKAYLHRALRCKDSDSDSIYCLANVYLAVLYYITGQYQTAIHHCALVTRLQDHSRCSSNVVQAELIPRIDDHIDSVLGLAVLYQHIQAALLNDYQEGRYVSVFTTELLAHYLHMKFLSLTQYRQHLQISLTDEIQRYRNCLCSCKEIFVTDVIVFCFADSTKYQSNDRLTMADSDENKSVILSQLDTSKLLELLLQSAVEHLTTCRELEACDFNTFTTVDFKALYKYNCGQYQCCLQLSVHNIHTLIAGKNTFMDTGPLVSLYSELIQLMDDDIVSLAGLATLANTLYERRRNWLTISQLCLSLYLMTQCQFKLHHSAASLSTTLDYVHFARFNIKLKFGYSRAVFGQDIRFEDDLLVLKLVEQKILEYMSVSQ